MLVEKLQQTSDIHVTVHVLLEAGQAAGLAAVASGARGARQPRHVPDVLAGGPQLRRQLRGQLGHLEQEAAEGAEVPGGGGLLLRAPQLREVQGGAGGVGKQSGHGLRETDLVSGVPRLGLFKWPTAGLHECNVETLCT